MLSHTQFCCCLLFKWSYLYDNNYIATDEVEMYCHRSRDRYFMVMKPRNYSTTTEITMTKYTLSRKAISLGANPEKWTF